MKLTVLTENPFFEQKEVIADFVRGDEHGPYIDKQKGILIYDDLFLHVSHEGVNVDRFKPREDGKVVIGVGYSEMVYPFDGTVDVDYDMVANMTVGEFFVYLVELKEGRSE